MSQVRICRLPPPLFPLQKWQQWPTVLNRLKNHFFHIFTILFSELWLIVLTIYGDTPSVPLTRKKIFKSGQIYRKDANLSDNDSLVHKFFVVRLLLVFEIKSILLITLIIVCKCFYRSKRSKIMLSQKMRNVLIGVFSCVILSF